MIPRGNSNSGEIRGYHKKEGEELQCERKRREKDLDIISMQ